MNRFETF